VASAKGGRVKGTGAVESGPRPTRAAISRRSRISREIARTPRKCSAKRSDTPRWRAGLRDARAADQQRANAAVR